MNRSIYKSSNF